jgi:hypothetical protein
MNRLLLIGVLLLLLAATVAADTEENPGLAKLTELYIDGEFQQVVIQGVELLAQPGLAFADSVKVVEMLAVSAAQEDKPEMSEKYLLALVKLDPNADFNSRRMSSRFASVWHTMIKKTGYVPGQKEKLVTVAVLEFANGSFVDADKVSNVGIGVASMINYQLEEAGALYCPSRENINYLLQELELSQTDLVDQDQKVDVGKVIGVKNYIITSWARSISWMATSSALMRV